MKKSRYEETRDEICNKVNDNYEIDFKSKKFKISELDRVRYHLACMLKSENTEEAFNYLSEARFIDSIRSFYEKNRGQEEAISKLTKEELGACIGASGYFRDSGWYNYIDQGLYALRKALNAQRENPIIVQANEDLKMHNKLKFLNNVDVAIGGGFFVGIGYTAYKFYSSGFTAGMGTILIGLLICGVCMEVENFVENKIKKGEWLVDHAPKGTDNIRFSG